MTYAHPGEPKLASFHEMAALDFEPWDIRLQELPNAEQINNPFMVNIRIAAVSLTKTKPELIKMTRAMGGDKPDGELFWTMVQGIQEAKEWCRQFSEILSAAEARLLCAASAVAVEDGWAED